MKTMQLYERVGEEVNFYTVKAHVGTIRAFKTFCLEQEKKFYRLKTFDDRLIEKIEEGNMVRSDHLRNQNRLDQCEFQPVNDQMVDEDRHEPLVNFQEKIIQSYIAGDYDHRKPSAVATVYAPAENIDIITGKDYYLMPTQPVQEKYVGGAKPLYIFPNLLCLPLELAAYHLFVTEQYDQLVSWNLDNIKNLFAIHYDHHVTWDDVVTMVQSGLIKERLPHVERKLDFSSKVLQKLK